MDKTFYTKTLEIQRKEYERINVEELKDDEVKARYEKTLDELRDRNFEESDINTKWKIIKEIIIKSAERVCKKKKSRTKKKGNEKVEWGDTRTSEQSTIKAILN